MFSLCFVTGNLRCHGVYKWKINEKILERDTLTGRRSDKPPGFNSHFNPFVCFLSPQVRASQGRCDPERVLLEAWRGLPVHQRPANPTMDSCDPPAELVLAPRSRRPHFGWGHQAQISTVTQCRCLSVPTPSPPLVAHVVNASALEARFLALWNSNSLSFSLP